MRHTSMLKAQGCTDAARTTYAHRIGRHVSVLLGARSRHCHCNTYKVVAHCSHCFIHFTCSLLLQSVPLTLAASSALTPAHRYCHVDFKDGNQYKYTNVSRRAIINLMMQPQMSLASGLTRTAYKLTVPATLSSLTTLLPDRHSSRDGSPLPGAMPGMSLGTTPFNVPLLTHTHVQRVTYVRRTC